MHMKPMKYGTNEEKTVLCEDTYQGYMFRIISYGTHPCAYVKIPNKHKCYKKNPENYSVYCHGGFTYSGNYLLGDLPSEKHDVWWVGWDYAHYKDYTVYSNYCMGGKKWTTEEIFEDVKDVIRQLAEVERSETS